MMTQETMYTSEGTYEPVDYITRVCSRIECTYQLWVGKGKQGYYEDAAPVYYEHMTREQAFTALLSRLNTGDPKINQFKRSYSAIHTREV